MFKTNTKWKYLRRPHKIINFCNYYVLEDNLENISFNKRFSDEELKKFLGKNYNYTKRFFRAITERIKNLSNIIIFISGTQNSGKSEAAQFLAFLIRYFLWKYNNIRVNIFFAFSEGDVQVIFSNFKPGDVIIRDEGSKLSGMGSVTTKDAVKNVLKAIRIKQNSFILLDPEDQKNVNVYYYLETAGKKSVNKCIRCKLEHHNLSRIIKRCYKCGGDLELLYHKCKIRLILYDKKKKILGHIYLPLHWNNIFRKKYNNKKNINLDMVIDNAGIVNNQIEGKRLNKDTQLLLKLCSEKGVRNKGEVWALLQTYNANLNNKKKKIKMDSQYVSILTTNVSRILREGNHNFKKINNNIEIKYEDNESFSKFCRNNIIDKSLAKIAEGLARGDNYKTINANYPELPYDFVKNEGNKLRREGSKNNMGFLFEKWYALSIGVPKEQLDILIAGSSDKPDLIWDNEVYTIKWRYDNKAHSIKFGQIKDFAPEYKYVKTNGLKHYYLIFMNPMWDASIINKIKISNESPDEIFVFKNK